MGLTRAIHMSYDILHWHVLRSHKVKVVDKATEIVAALNKQSYYILPNFMPPSAVEKLRHELETARDELEKTEEGRSKLHGYNMVHNKVRWAGVDKVVQGAADYANDPFIMRVAELFHGEPTRTLKCTYDVKKFNKHFSPGDLNEIELGDHVWHVDRPYGVLKTMLLLRDVTDDDGPFEIVPGSHRPQNNGFRGFLHWLKMTLEYYILNTGPGPYAQPGKERYRFHVERAIRLTGKAGDLIFVNTGAWHHGPELGPNGHRQVLWNYLYSQQKLTRVKLLRTLLRRPPLTC